MKRLFNIDHNNKLVDSTLLLTRVVITLLMLMHGYPKIQGFAESPVKFLDIFGLGATLSLILAVFSEVVCSIFILIGLGTRLAVIPLIIAMLIAVFHVHSNDPFAKQELGLHFLLVYVVLFILGSGKYSVDSLFFKRNNAIY